MTLCDKSVPFSYQERVVVSPVWSTTRGSVVSADTEDRHWSTFRVRLETRAASLVSNGKDNITMATPFPSAVKEVLKRFQASRILIQTSSSSTSSSLDAYQRNNGPDSWEDSSCYQQPYGYINSPYSSPSGLAIMAWFVLDEDHSEDQVRIQFTSLLSHLADRRIVLASLDSVESSRIHRWIHVERREDNKVANIWKASVVLPTEIGPMSAEGVSSFQTALTPQSCFNTGVLGSIMSISSMSNLLLGASPSTISSLVPRSTWIDLKSSGVEDSTSPVHHYVHRGIQYGVTLERAALYKSIPLSRLIPEDSQQQRIEFKSCPIAESTRIVSMGESVPNPNSWKVVPLSDSDPFDHFMIPITSSFNEREQQLSSNNGWSLSQTILRPRGISNTGTLITEVHHSADQDYDCQIASTAFNLTIIVPDFVLPSWKSFQVVHRFGNVARDETVSVWSAIQQDVGWMVHHDVSFYQTGTAVVKLDMILPPNSRVTASLDYNPKLLSFEEFPGDPNRGIEMPPSHAVIMEAASAGTDGRECKPSARPYTLYSNGPLLLMPPVPDMSMPFNAISLTCTLYAFILGTILNLLLRKSSERVSRAFHNKPPPKHKLRFLKDKFVQRVKSLRRKKTPHGHDKTR